MIYLLLCIIIISIILIYTYRIETFKGITIGNSIFKETNPNKYFGMGTCIKNNLFGFRDNNNCITMNDMKQKNTINKKSLNKKKSKNIINNITKKKLRTCNSNDYVNFSDCVNKDNNYCRKNYGKNYEQSFIKCDNNKVRYRCTKKESELKSNEFVTKCYPKLSNFDDICSDEGWNTKKNPNYGVKDNTVYNKYLCPVGYSTATCSDLYKNYKNKYGNYEKISDCIKINEIDNYVKENCASYHTRSGNYDCPIDKERVICY